MKKDFLRETLAKESRAYGFTIAFWGSGALLIKSHGLPSLLEALSYGFGAVIGFGILTLLAYQNPFKSIEYKRENIPALSIVHYIAALLPLVASFYLSRLNPVIAFLSTGISVATIYNLGMLVEEYLDIKLKSIFQS